MSAPDAKAELLPCPFCGGKAEIERPGTARQSMMVACTICGGRCESGDVVGLTPIDAWRWNQRARNDQLNSAERLAKWAQEGPPLAKAAGCYVGIMFSPAPPVSEGDG